MPVYFIQAETGGPIKIGYSAQIEERISQLQIGNPNKLKVIASTPGAHALEAAMHRHFSEHHLGGEWFKDHADVVSAASLLAAGMSFDVDTNKCPKSFSAWVRSVGGQNTAADIVGVDQSTISLWLRGIRKPLLDGRLRLEEITSGLVKVSDWPAKEQRAVASGPDEGEHPGTAAIRNAMKNKGMGVPELANKSGVHKTVVYRWLSGSCVISAKNAPHIAEVLGIPVSEVLYGSKS